jgi:hypothetical protein
VFRRNVIALAILIDSGEVIFAITFAWMFLLTKYSVSVDLSSHPQMNVTHAKIAEAAVAGTSAFSMACRPSLYRMKRS